MCQACGDGFRFEATELSTGRVKAVLHPIEADWEEALCQPSTASLTLATRDPSADDIWPNETGLFISRILGPDERECYFGGYIENFDGGSGGGLQVAAVSMDTYWNHRLVADDDGGLSVDGGVGFMGLFVVKKPVDNDPNNDITVFTGSVTTQTQFAQYLVGLANTRGVPLTTVIEAPAVQPLLYTTWRWWEFRNIGGAIQDLVAASPGLKYWLTHTYNDGYWSTVAHFSDSIGTARDYTLRSDYEGWQYALNVDGKDKASRVYGVGGGKDENTQFSVAYDQAERLPEFQSTIAWKDQTEPATIDALTVGQVADHRDASAVPSMTLVGLPTTDDPGKGYPPPSLLKPGDTFGVDIGYGAITVKDITVKALGIAWKLTDGSPIQRVIAMLPVLRPADSIRTQTPARPPALEEDVNDVSGSVTADPFPTPGLLTKIHPNYLHEISGMQVSYANPGHVWVHNDNEVAGSNPVGTVYLVAYQGPNAGKVGAKFHVGTAADPPFDTEAIRYRNSDGTLWLGDLGDNDAVRSFGRLYMLPEPVGGGNKGKLPSTIIRIKYPFSGGWLNTESLMINPLNDHVYTMTKEAGQSRIVDFGSSPTNNMTGTVVTTLEDVEFVVDATFTANGQFLLVRAFQVQPTLVYSTTTWERVGRIPTPAMPKSESITLDYPNPTCSFLVGTEAKPHAPVSETETPIYRVLIPTKFGANCGKA